MQNYSYIALNNESQQLKGIISAEDSCGARKKLHEMGLSVIILEETNEKTSSFQPNTSNEGMQNFEFFVVDSQGKSLNGTIEAVDKKNALRRLATEYNFKVLSLASTNLPPDTRFEEGKKGMSELIEETELEFGITINREEVGEEDSQLKGLVSEGFEEERQMLMEEIDTITQKTTQILIEYQERIPPETIDDTRKYLDELMRLKLSNNLVLIRKLTEALFKKVDDLIEAFINREMDGERAKELKEALAEEHEEMEKNRSAKGNSYKSITNNLKALSAKLDHILGNKVVRKKKKEEKTGISVLLKESNRVWKMFFSALFTTNTTLRNQRLSEAKKLWDGWSKKWEEFQKPKTEGESLKTSTSQRKTLKDMRAEMAALSEISQTRAEEWEEDDSPSETPEDSIYVPESDLISIFFREIRFFLGSLLAVFLLFFFFSDIFLLYSIQPISGSLERVIASNGLALFCVFLFFAFFFLTIRERFFWGKTFQSSLFFVFMSGVMFLYAVNY